MERKLTMYKKISTVLIVILCICIMAAATIVAYAEGETEGGNTSDTTSETTESQETSSGDTDPEDEGSAESETDSKDESGENTSDESGTEPTDSGTESATSSKSSGGSGKIKSGGAKGTTKTFILENFDDNGNSPAVIQSDSEDEDTEGEYAGYDEGEEEELTDHFVGRVVSYGDRFYRWIYIPAIISVLCIVALLYINLIYKKRIA